MTADEEIILGTSEDIPGVLTLQEANLAHKQDRVVGPEISCKVLKATPLGSATELNLVCNGEGQRGVRQKERVQVVNGRLGVGGAKYLRCP